MYQWLFCIIPIEVNSLFVKLSRFAYVQKEKAVNIFLFNDNMSSSVTVYAVTHSFVTV